MKRIIVLCLSLLVAFSGAVFCSEKERADGCFVVTGPGRSTTQSIHTISFVRGRWKVVRPTTGLHRQMTINDLQTHLQLMIDNHGVAAALNRIREMISIQFPSLPQYVSVVDVHSVPPSDLTTSAPASERRPFAAEHSPNQCESLCIALSGSRFPLGGDATLYPAMSDSVSPNLSIKSLVLEELFGQAGIISRDSDQFDHAAPPTEELTSMRRAPRRHNAPPTNTTASGNEQAAEQRFDREAEIIAGLLCCTPNQFMPEDEDAGRSSIQFMGMRSMQNLGILTVQVINNGGLSLAISSNESRPRVAVNDYRFVLLISDGRLYISSFIPSCMSTSFGGSTLD